MDESSNATILLSVRNTAEKGPFISLQNFHGDGNLASSPVGIVVECDRGSSAAVAEPAHLQLDTETGAYFDKSQFGAAGQGVPNTPLAHNLEPGETGQIVLSLSSFRNFGGVDGKLSCVVLSAKFAGDCQVSSLFGQAK
jgi:hypothetical protein